MPAYDLPPLESLPPVPISGGAAGQIQHDAEWARTFPESAPADTNLVERSRRFRQQQQSLSDEAQLIARQRADAQMQKLESSKLAQSLWLGRQKLDLQHQEAQQRMLLAEEKARRDAELHPLKMQTEQARFEADTRRAAAIERAEAFKQRNVAREADDTTRFLDTVSAGEAKGIRPHTPEYADLLTNARLKAPAMKSDYFDDIWKSTSASKLTPEEAINQAVLREKALSQARSEAKAPAAEISSLERERALHVRMLDRAKRIRSRATDDNVKADADADIQESEKSLAEVESQIRSRREGAAGKEPPKTPPTTTAAASSDGGGLTPDVHNAAMEWAKANPNDPRAAAIRARNGL